MSQVEIEFQRAMAEEEILKDFNAEGAFLAGMDLEGLKGDFLRLNRANLNGASLAGSHFMDIDFEECQLANADFEGAELSPRPSFQERSSPVRT